MYWLNNRTRLLIVLFVFSCVYVHAAEEEAKSKPAKEGKEAATAELNDKEFSGHQTEEWMNVQNQLTTLKGKVENQKKLVESLIQQKEITKGAEQIEKIEELKIAHSEYIRVIEAYNQMSTTFQTKFPEKGGTVGRVYKRIDPANIESMKNKMSAEGRLQKLNKTIEKQYSKSVDSSDVNKAALAHKKSNKKVLLVPMAAPVEKVQEVQVTDQIILQK